MLVSCFCVFIHFSLIGDTDLFSLPWQVYGLGFLIAVFATVIPSFMVSASIKIISSSNFAIVAGVGPISTIILASFFLDEKLTPPLDFYQYWRNVEDSMVVNYLNYLSFLLCWQYL